MKKLFIFLSLILITTIAWAADKYITSPGDVVIKTAASKSVNLNGTLYTTQDGKVGIGATDPSNKLELRDGIFEIDHRGGTDRFFDFKQFSGWNMRLIGRSTSTYIGIDSVDAGGTTGRPLVLNPSGGNVSVGSGWEYYGGNAIVKHNEVNALNSTPYTTATWSAGTNGSSVDISGEVYSYQGILIFWYHAHNSDGSWVQSGLVTQTNGSSVPTITPNVSARTLTIGNFATGYSGRINWKWNSSSVTVTLSN